MFRLSPHMDRRIWILPQFMNETKGEIEIKARKLTPDVKEAYVQKGNLLWVEGEMHMREYVTREGIQKQVTEVIANNVQFFRNEPVR